MTKPSWYVVATQDGAINPALERKIAIQSKAKTTEVKGSHVVFVSQPLAVANVITEAATTSPAPSKSNWIVQPEHSCRHAAENIRNVRQPNVSDGSHARPQQQPSYYLGGISHA
jgi:hypothetical protein